MRKFHFSNLFFNSSCRQVASSYFSVCWKRPAVVLNELNVHVFLCPETQSKHSGTSLFLMDVLWIPLPPWALRLTLLVIQTCVETVANKTKYSCTSHSKTVCVWLNCVPVEFPPALSSVLHCFTLSAFFLIALTFGWYTCFRFLFENKVLNFEQTSFHILILFSKKTLGFSYVALFI